MSSDEIKALIKELKRWKSLFLCYNLINNRSLYVRE
jgi:hypothetical protein